MKAGLESKGKLKLHNGEVIELTVFKKQNDNGVFWSVAIDKNELSEVKEELKELKDKLGVSDEVKEELPM